MNTKIRHCPFCLEKISVSDEVCPYCGERQKVTIYDASELFKYVKRTLSDQYEILSEIGKTGLLYFYQAFKRENFEETFLLQILHPHKTTHRQKQRFLKENEITASLRHANILQIYDYGKIKDLYYVVSEDWQGESLADYFRKGRHFTEEDCLRIMTKVAKALSYTHNNGIIHGQLNPEQILINKANDVRIKGFAYAADTVNPEERMGINIYHSPEQIKGLPFDKRTDIYSLALILYRCLTGELPQELSNPLKLMFYAEGDAIQIRLKEELKSYVRLFQKALSIKREKRYASTLGFTKALRKVVNENTSCPICGTTKSRERFTCPECGRENICLKHKTREGICTECAERKRKEQEAKRQEEESSDSIEEFARALHKGKTPVAVTSSSGGTTGKIGAHSTPKQNGTEFSKSIWKFAALLGIVVLIIWAIFKATNSPTTPQNMNASSSYSMESSGSSDSYNNGTTSDEYERQQKTDRLYRQALEYLAANKLTTPKGSCALDMANKLSYYDDAKSKEILQKISEKYKSWGNSRYNQGDYGKALKYYRKALNLEPYNQELKNLIARAEQERQKWLNMFDWVWVEGGTFKMGCTSEQNNCDGDEKPVHEVYVDGFYMSKYEVTFYQYDTFCEATGRRKPDDNGWWCGNCPVIYVSWNDAVAFCQWFSKKTGTTIRLPTEAEWEYAARGGQKSRGYKYAGSNNPDEVAWYLYNSGKKTHPVGQKKPNELGLYDMSGNVWEWCWDWYGENYYSQSPRNNPKGPSGGSDRVVRGGSCTSYARGVRLATRGDYGAPSYGLSSLGFRLLRTK